MSSKPPQSTSTTTTSTSTTSSSSRPVHPAYIPTFSPSNAELSTWAYLTSPRPFSSSPSTTLPNLVVAHSSTIKIYTIDTSSLPSSTTTTLNKLKEENSYSNTIGKALILTATYDNLAGSVCTLHTLSSSLSSSSHHLYDGLLLGFSGHPRLSIVYPSSSFLNEENNWGGSLVASSIVDLTSVTEECCFGGCTALDMDVKASVQEKSKRGGGGEDATVCVILGGGVGVATFTLIRAEIPGCEEEKKWWRIATEPYLLPLLSLSQSFLSDSMNTPSTATIIDSKKRSTTTTKNESGIAELSNTGSISHNFGEVLDCVFLSNYAEPTLCFLHASSGSTSSGGGGGRIASGRLGRANASRKGATKYGLSLTCVNISIPMQRSVILWSLPSIIPTDAQSLIAHWKNGVLVMGINTVTYVNSSGKILYCLAVNGFGGVGCTLPLLPSRYRYSSSSSGKTDGINEYEEEEGGKMEGNPTPLSKLSIQLDGAKMEFVQDNVAIVCLRDGTLYSLEIHNCEKKTKKKKKKNEEKITLQKKLFGYQTNFLSSNTSSIIAKRKKRGNHTILSLSKLGMKVGGLGMISSLSHLSLRNRNFCNGVGLLFAASRLGDSTLLMYSLKTNVPLLLPEEEEEEEEEDGSKSKTKKRKRIEENDDDDEPPAKLTKKENESKQSTIQEEEENNVVTISEPEDNNNVLVLHQEEYNDQDEEILFREEQELYAPLGDHDDDDQQSITRTQNLILPSDEEESSENEEQKKETKYKRPQLSSLSIFTSIYPLDCLTALGPLGPKADGPVFTSPTPTSPKQPPTLGDGTRHAILPCGYGSSGGLAIVSTPGKDGGCVVGEEDVKNVNLGGVWCLKKSGVVILGVGRKKEGECGVMIMRFLKKEEELVVKKEEVVDGKDGNEEEKEGETAAQLCEIDISEWCNINSSDDAMEVEEPTNPSFKNAWDVFVKTTIISASEWNVTTNDLTSSSSPFNPFIVLLVKHEQKYAIIILQEKEENEKKQVKLEYVHVIKDTMFDEEEQRGKLKSVTTMMEYDSKKMVFGCVWSSSGSSSSGHGSVFIIDYNDDDDSQDEEKFCIKETLLRGDDDDVSFKMEEEEDREEDEEEDVFYKSENIVAMDLFCLSKNVFFSSQTSDGIKEEMMEESSKTKKENENESPAEEHKNEEKEEENEVLKSSSNVNYFDADDLELYGSSYTSSANITTSSSQPTAAAGENSAVQHQQQNDASSSMAPSRMSTVGGRFTPFSEKDGEEDAECLHIGLCRRSGRIQIFDVAKLCHFDDDSTEKKVIEGDAENSLLWEANGCGHGALRLTPSKKEESNSTTPPPLPKFHDLETVEMRFFLCGPSSATGLLKSLCLILDTNLGDVHMYIGSRSPSSNKIEFARIPLGIVTRPSKEEGRHRAKLRRKGILTTSANDNMDSTFRPNRLHKFTSISKQDGVFVASHRPFWILSERGAPTVVFHKSRHIAPAGGKALPISGFCSNLGQDDQEGGFLTLHERIGRVGSQRLTLFRGLSDVFTPHGILPGGGICIQKIPLGVTVRRIKFIDDATISSPSHPLYVLLISREIESDQSHLNDDGLTSEERQRARDEKEAVKTQRQVEADLGGFDVEQEWVEEIEREDCFEVDQTLGGAPPIADRVYEVWLVDAARGWEVVSTFPLEEYEHGMAMDVIALTEVIEETGTGAPTTAHEQAPEDTVFIAVGTGIVDQDGEDISSKGRVLLFEVKKTGNSTTTSHNRNKSLASLVELSLTYEKNISLGPVTSLNALTCEGKTRVVVGAGAEITIEQWGGGKLTQVGFFHANMQVKEITLFKTFFLLSDAYDSLYFLVWRESDKSLTLLAKDYEPIPVYAAGLISRGGAMSFICQDDRQNIQFFQYAPNDPAARGGNKLVCRADFHLGDQTISFGSHWCRSSLLINSATPNSTLAALKRQDTLFGRVDDDQRFAVNFGTTDGAFGSVVPLSEQVYWRLTALQSVMSNALESNCALSQRSWRLYRRTPRRGGCRSNDRKKGVIDGALISKYADLPLTDQEDLASAIGSTVELILDNILELGCSSAVV